jgi:hypothetical protein
MTARDRFLKEFPKSITDDAAAIFVGAGVSVGAGYPSWRDLLKDIGAELGVEAGDIIDLAALAQWSMRKSAGRTRINNVIRAEIAPEKPVPDTLSTIVRLPIRNIWTTNYDRLIERAFSEIGRPVDPISAASDLAIKPRPGAARLFKMHGSVDRLDDIVIATDDYELYRLNRAAFLSLLQAHMTSFSMLFVGLSFTDPNMRHVLSMIRESFASSPPEHFAIVKPPQRSDFGNAKQFKARLTQHSLWADDLLRYGLHVVPVDHFDEVPALMREVERRVASSRVWISGSWPLTGGVPEDLTYVAEVSAAVGQVLGENDFALVNGSGLTVGSAAISGFLSALQRSGSWDLERRLIARPFPQPLEGQSPNREQWAALRAEMARVSGAVVFIGGAKIEDGKVVDADGVRAEFDAARRTGAILIPIGSTGGIARDLANEMLAAPGISVGGLSRRPTKKTLQALMKKATPSAVAKLVVEAVREGQRT